MEHRKSKIHYLAGPTGVGKTTLALTLADRLEAEIVGADAFQVYSGLPLLTAQPASGDLQRVRHHLIGCVPPAETFDAHSYAALAKPRIADILEQGRTVLVVGGTGLYFRALIEGFAPTPPPNYTLRSELELIDLPALIERLYRSDAGAPAQVDVKNKRRVIRAIEIVEGSGQPLENFRQTPSVRASGLLLTRDRDDLWKRIESNVHEMFKNGVVDEVAALGNSIGPTASRAIGLREIQALIRGELDRVDCEKAIVTATRQYAKRQLTWFRNQTRFPLLDLTTTQHPSDTAETALFAVDVS